MGSNSIAMKTLHKAKNMEDTKSYIREWQDRADRDPKGALKRGVGACLEIDVPMPQSK